MAVAKHQTDDSNDFEAPPGIQMLSADDSASLFDRQARSLLHISGAEFLRRWDRGDYRPVPDTAEGRKIRRLVMLMPFVRTSDS